MSSALAEESDDKKEEKFENLKQSLLDLSKDNFESNLSKDNFESKEEQKTVTTPMTFQESVQAMIDLVSMLENFFPSLMMMRLNKLEYLYLAITFLSSLTFAGSSRSLPNKGASERHSDWVGSALALKF